MQFYEFCMPSNPPSKNVGWNIGWKEVLLFKQCCAVEAQHCLIDKVYPALMWDIQRACWCRFKTPCHSEYEEITWERSFLIKSLRTSSLSHDSHVVRLIYLLETLTNGWSCNENVPSVLLVCCFVNATNNSNTVTTLVFAQHIQHRGNKSLLVAFVMQEHQ